MINILLVGVGGQGTVLAAKVLAQAAQSKGWQVRTAETIGMAQRGGSVVSHDGESFPLDDRGERGVSGADRQGRGGSPAGNRYGERRKRQDIYPFQRRS